MMANCWNINRHVIAKYFHIILGNTENTNKYRKDALNIEIGSNYRCIATKGVKWISVTL